MNYKNLISEINNFEEFKIVKSKLNGATGPISLLIEKLKNCSNEEKKQIGFEIKVLKDEINQLLNEKLEEINKREFDEKIKNDHNDIFDFDLNFDYIHPIEEIISRFRQWFMHNGYFEETFPEIETDIYNFQKLNIPKNHPSRDMQDTLYISKNKLLRTHNTGITARLLEKYSNKVFSAFAVGKVYRNDEDDQTHSHQFTQIDLVSVGEVSCSNLMWTLKSLLSFVLEEDVKIRFRPSFFPFTEPSVEVDIYFKNRWVEVLGAGMLNEKIINFANFSKGFRGFAAGIGMERIAMIKYSISDIREFYKNDLRFLKQFKIRRFE
ncbi:MAG: phenylalanine--tRNA ligase subunit alpha [Metamycoplasmataceae bacterium]